MFDKMFSNDEEKKHFFENICTPEWNEKQDAGRPLKEATEELVTKHPEWKEYIEAYYGRWEEMLGGPIHGTVAILKQLKDSGKYRLYALTNWSAELFPIALERYEFLHWFDGRAVSGEEKMRKPFREFYDLLVNRFQLDPQNSLFIDDSLRNIEGAREMGFKTIAFRSPSQLKEELIQSGIL